MFRVSRRSSNREENEILIPKDPTPPDTAASSRASSFVSVSSRQRTAIPASTASKPLDEREKVLQLVADRLEPQDLLQLSAASKRAKTALADTRKEVLTDRRLREQVHQALDAMSILSRTRTGFSKATKASAALHQAAQPLGVTADASDAQCLKALLDFVPKMKVRREAGKDGQYKLLVLAAAAVKSGVALNPAEARDLAAQVCQLVPQLSHDKHRLTAQQAVVGGFKSAARQLFTVEGGGAFGTAAYHVGTLGTSLALGAAGVVPGGLLLAGKHAAKQRKTSNAGIELAQALLHRVPLNEGVRPELAQAVCELVRTTPGENGKALDRLVRALELADATAGAQARAAWRERFSPSRASPRPASDPPPQPTEGS